MRFLKIPFRVSFIFIAIILLTSGVSAQGYRNVVNIPFNTVSDGPQNALVVDVADPGDEGAVRQAIESRLRPARSARSAMAEQLDALARAGLVKPGHKVQLYSTVVLRSGGKLLLDAPARIRQGTPKAQFVITTQEGWTAQQAQFLKAFADLAYPIVEQVYGPPANDITVRVMRATALTDPQFTSGGVYVASTTPRQILLPPSQGFDNYVQGDTYDQVRVNLLHLMIRAFHDTAFVDYHAWEEGISRAATVVVMTLLDRNVDLTTGFDTYFLMPVYDLVNQPPLGNNTFYPTSGFDGMLIFRLGMSASAWLKVYIENNNFFRAFNSAYYLQVEANPALAGNIPQLRALVKGIAPEVEGIDFDRWYERQYVLDTSVAPGNNLYAFNAPVLATSTDTSGYSVIVLLCYFNTAPSGDEAPLAGTSYPIYRDSEYQPIFPGAQYERVDITGGTRAFIANFVISDNSGNPDTQRLIIDFPAGNETARVYFPYAAQPSVAGNRDFVIIGVVAGADSGDVAIRLQNNTQLAATIRKGAFGVKQATTDVLYTRTAFTYDGQTRQVNFLRRAPADSFDYVAVLLQAREAAVSRTYTFPKGLSMVSIPIRPLESSLTSLFNLPYDRFILAHWDQAKSGDIKYLLNQATPPFRPDYGYWLRLDSDLQVTVTGTLPGADAPYAMGLVEGWNQVGFPFEKPVPKSGLSVQYLDQEILSFDQAVASGWVGSSIWEYNPATGYQTVTQLEPGRGYWVKAKRTSADKPFGMALIIPPPTTVGPVGNTPAKAAATRAAFAGDNWQLVLVARAGNRQAQAALGVSRSAREEAGPEDAEGPPDFSDYVAIQFSHPDWGADAGQYRADIRSAGGTRRAWEFEVKTDFYNAPVTLTWPQAQRLPKTLRLTLIDLSTGEKRFLRTASGYTFNAGGAGSRSFRIEADTSGAAGLMITGLTAVPTRGSGSTIAYTLSAPAQVTAAVLSLTGKPVRLLASSRAVSSGSDQIIWNGRSQQGSIVPAGTYLVQITAVTPEGETSKAVTQVMVGR
ncbi:MAG: hypothetical protein IT210_08155 [Armatimonadetes bacterium]|nr:hypothetical protein [Armatimonadota bacterium]